jgi:UDP-N-acetylglucosamine--N-acetylmuramyl-(pentapeptide) pyrophosphoryl-undecaprenol N-acetylglucosamine transferase
LPAILIPFPYAAEDHQSRNAEIFVRAEAALLLKEAELTDDRLAQTIRRLGGDSNELQRMAQNCARLSPRDAAGLVASTMEKYTNDDRRA